MSWAIIESRAKAHGKTATIILAIGFIVDYLSGIPGGAFTGPATQGVAALILLVGLVLWVWITWPFWLWLLGSVLEARKK